MLYNGFGLTLSLAVVGLSFADATYYSGYQEMLDSVNQQRASAGKSALCNSSKLMASTLEQSNYQASITTMTHDSPTPLMDRFTNQGYDASSVAENVGVSGSDDVSAIMDAWINSEDHRANILGDYTHFGSAAVKGSDGQYYWTQHFGTSMSADEPCMDGSEPTSTTSSSPSTVTSTSASSSPTESSDSNIPSGTPTSTESSTSEPTSQSQTDSSSSSSPPPPPPLSTDNTATQGEQPMDSSLPRGLSPPTSGPKFICIRSVCYRIVHNSAGEGFIPDQFKPANVDISQGPVYF